MITSLCSWTIKFILYLDVHERKPCWEEQKFSSTSTNSLPFSDIVKARSRIYGISLISYFRIDQTLLPWWLQCTYLLSFHRLHLVIVSLTFIFWLNWFWQLLSYQGGLKMISYDEHFFNTTVAHCVFGELFSNAFWQFFAKLYIYSFIYCFVGLSITHHNPTYLPVPWPLSLWPAQSKQNLKVQPKNKIKQKQKILA